MDAYFAIYFYFLSFIELSFINNWSQAYLLILSLTVIKNGGRGRENWYNSKQNKQGEKEMKTKKEYSMQDQKVERSLSKLNSATQNKNYKKSCSKRRRREDKKTLKKTD